MLNTVNNIISISRMITANWESWYSSIEAWVSCYIEPAQPEVAVNIDWASFSDVFNFFSDYTNIVIWDKFIDKDWDNYKVKWVKIFDDFLWKHTEAILLKVYD